MSEQLPRADEMGTTVAGRYLIDGLLGGGGMAAVYKVRDARTNKHVALKRGLSVGKGKPSKRKELLEREFHTLAQLAHPCIIEVYDYGVDEHGAYYTMEMLDGADLHKTGQVPWRQACSLLRDVASSLALLHSRGLIHRDVSARNVRRTADGRAKLIDFGAMTGMGVAKDVVGTPPFLAPEVLQMQALDGRADLFSLGALGYYILTGTHAYPARRFRDLRDAWRSRPAAINKLQPDVPAALSALIMQLLSLDRGARLHSAAETIQRLCTIADLPVEEQTEISRAYLATPTLLGRDAALVSARRRMLALARGDGGTLLMNGAAGSGRSRMLDACALEAKLVGAAVIRADASVEHSDWAVVRVLGAQLLQLMPEQTAEAARLSRDVLSQVIDGLRGDGSTSVSAVIADRSLLIRELRDFMLSLARVQRLVILVDDVDQIDEPSVALLAALAHKTERHPLILVLAVNHEAAGEPSPSLRFLGLVADHVPLTALAAEQTEALLRSVFGDVPRLPMVAARVHALSTGNPRAIMALAQHMVDRGLARYESGSWSLPSELGERDLPESLAASLAARVRALSNDAIEICEALCLADSDGDGLSLAGYAELTTHGEQRRVFRALDELEVARVLVADSERHRFSQRGFVAVVEDMISEARRQWLHARLADMLASTGGDVIKRANHLLCAGREREAVELLQSLDLKQRYAPLEMLVRVVEVAERRALPARQIHEFRKALLNRAGTELAVDIYRQHAPIVLRELVRDSGLLRYNQLADLPENERLTRAIADTQQRQEAEPPHQRVAALGDAIRGLASFCGAQRGLAVAVFDLSLLESLPSLAPFVPLSPVMALIELGREAAAATIRGRFNTARDCYEQMLARLASPEAANLQPNEHSRAFYGAHQVLGLVDAGRGIATAEAHAEVLERERAHQVSAWRVRMLYHLTLGNTEEAARCRRRAELALLREGAVQSYIGTTGLGELICHVLCGDLLGVTQTNETLARLASRFDDWRPFLVWGQANSLRMQGDTMRALELLLPTLERVEPGEHAAFAYMAATHVQLLCDLGNTYEAVEHGLKYVELCERLDLTPTAHVVHVATAVALARSGDHAAGVHMVEGVIEIARSRNQGGVCIGSMYEARARIAALMQDREGFQHYADRCAEAYQQGANANLAAKLASLLDEARSSELGHVNSSIPVRTSLSQPPGDSSEYATLHSRMLECVDESDRARCALTILLQCMDSFAGYLYGINERDHILLASLPEDEVDSELETWFEEMLTEELGEPNRADVTRRRTRPRDEEDADVTRRARPGRDHSQVAFRFTDARGRVFEPMFLIKHDGPQQRLAAVLIFHAGRGSGKRPSREIQEELVDQLLTHGDVTGAALALTNTQTHTH
jgi:tRNA A-37 threonylcarbamoyl transferase component Bud32